MQRWFLAAMLFGALVLGFTYQNNRWELPLYIYHQTWQGGQIQVLVSYDWRLGIQKRIVGNQ